MSLPIFRTGSRQRPASLSLFSRVNDSHIIFSILIITLLDHMIDEFSLATDRYPVEVTDSIVAVYWSEKIA